MTNGTEHLEVVREMLKVIYDLGYEGHWKSLRQNGSDMEITIVYRQKPDPEAPSPGVIINYG